MIHEVDESLRSFITSDAVNGGVEVTFESPTRDWASRQGAPTINVFLYDIREDLQRRDVAPMLVRNDDGVIIDRRPPPRRFKLSYLITAWTQRPEDEHRLLSILLARFLQFDALPPDHLEGSLAETPIPVIMTLALPAGPDRSLSDIWSALGGEMKPSLDLNVVAPINPGREFTTGPPVIEKPILDVTPGSVRPGGKLHHRTIKPLLDDDGSAPDEEVVAGGKKQPGRTLRLSRKE